MLGYPSIRASGASGLRRFPPQAIGPRISGRPRRSRATTGTRSTEGMGRPPGGRCVGGASPRGPQSPSKARGSDRARARDRARGVDEPCWREYAPRDCAWWLSRPVSHIADLGRCRWLFVARKAYITPYAWCLTVSNMSDKSDRDNHSNQGNPNSDTYWESRGYYERPDDWEDRADGDDEETRTKTTSDRRRARKTL